MNESEPPRVATGTSAGGVVVVVTCEHGGNEVPADLAHLFESEAGRLKGHLGYDAGALEMARAFAAAFAAPLFFSTVTRQVVDGNRSPGHKKLFSRVTKQLQKGVRHDILARHYQPLRRETLAAVSAVRAAGHTVVHLSSHSFVPVFKGQVRTMDIGLLYDPGREGERRLCQAWKRGIEAARPDLRVRRNAPYRGVSDGHVTALRRRFPYGYLGIELEVNQRFFLEDRPAFEALLDLLPRTFAAALASRAFDGKDPASSMS
ncbi:N-formylglutamate amidohydrolase [Desulfolutivibrio sulfoxidireducens]|uniref:N-formylglutamate amidohydrolase n=1 Tax=Desulfolutivibrio sulfoxidireducens TaxID=2773299 RepID=UPI00159D46C8|nr:N-formylglutamate amidohydrolase [Desulfolutivibrio sulfoxidireducens]QLA16076.1 N-formylglutamate amidohydrolase [Desulfolutivibrio sulfoxidireducens]